MNQTLQIILNTLNQIEVKGKANIDKLLGVIIAVEQLIATMKQQATPAEDEPNGEGE